MGAKLYFAPLPPRAIGDKRLAGLHFRVLAAIALHDRMSASRKTGQGCWAGNQKLALLCDCNYNNLSTTVGDLVNWGYVLREPHPINKRLRIYRVIYGDADCSPMGEGLPASKSLANRTAKARESSREFDESENVRPEANGSAGTVRPDFENAELDQWIEDVEYIPQKREDIPLKGIINSAEAAPSNGIDSNLGAELARFERLLKSSGEKLPTETLRTWAEYLTTIHLEGTLDDPNAMRAGRMIGDVEEELLRRGAL